MPADKNLIWRFVEEGFNQGREAVVFEVCHPKYRNDHSVMAVPEGPEGLAAHIRNGRGNIAGIRLNIVDTLAEGDQAAVCWQTRGRAGGYVGDGRAAGDTSAWLVGFCGYEDGLIRHHVINWEPLRLMAQSGGLDAIYAKRGALPAADLAGFALKALRCEAYTTYAPRAEAVAPRVATPAQRAAIAALVDATLAHGFSAGTGPAADELVSRDAYLSYAEFPDQRGPAGLAARRAAFGAAFSDARIEVKKLIVEAGRAAVRFELTCTNSGAYAGLPATGRPVLATGSAYARIEDGRIVEWIELIDVLRILRQLGSLASVMPGCYPDQ
jgi:predicted ester cyclase